MSQAIPVALVVLILVITGKGGGKEKGTDQH